MASPLHRHLLLSPPPSPTAARATVPMLFPVFILFFLLLCFLSVFLFRDILLFTTAFLSSRAASRPNGNPLPSNHDNPADYGLDPAILASFPTLPYAAVVGIREGKCGAECAVCLAEFAASDVIRLLTVCCHAFHPPCIDSWLAAHATCPVCRSDLEAPPDEAAVMAVRRAIGGDGVLRIDVGEVAKAGAGE